MISIESKQGELLNPLRKILETFPGDVYEGDLTGHGYEWRAEYVVDYAPSNEDETEEDEFVLSLSIYPKAGTGSFRAELSLEHHVPEVGVEDKEPIPLGDLESIATALAKHACEWDLRKDTVEIAGPYLTKVAKVAQQISGGAHA
jgi:hypothetical protein